MPTTWLKMLWSRPTCRCQVIRIKGNSARGLARTLIGGTEADASFVHQDLYLALRTLPPKERSAITLYYLNGYSIKEIAKITDTSDNAVKQQLSRGRDKLKQILEL